MYKTIGSKIKIFIILIILVVSIIAIKKLIVDPQPVRDIKMNIVYMCGSGTEYPDDDQSRYYIEFKNDGTYVLIHDDSRRKKEDYFEDGYRSFPEIDIHFGKYKVKNNNYYIKPTEGAGVRFKDVSDVKKHTINGYGHSTYINDKRTAWRIVQKSKWGIYQLGSLNSDKTALNKQKLYYTLYNKSDIKKLPSSPEEFRKQFKMDKKAEQERLAEQKRLAEQSQ